MSTDSDNTAIVISSDKKKQKPVYSQVPIRFDDETESKLQVYKSDRLAFSKSNLRLNDHKIFNAYISQINPLGIYPNGLDFILTRKQISEMTGIDENEVHRHAVSTAERLSEISFIDRTYNTETFEHEIEILNLVEKAKYKNGELYLKMTSTAEEHLINLKRYGYFGLDAQKKIKSKHGMGLLEMVCAVWHVRKGLTQTVELDIDDVKYACGIIDEAGRLLKSSYARFNDFKKRVLEPAIADLGDTDEFDVLDVEFVKLGRLYKKIKLTLRRQPKIKNIITDKNSSIEDRLAEHGFGQDRWSELYLLASMISEALDNVTDKDVLTKCLEYVEERDYIQHFDKYFMEVLTLGVPFLPAWADPFGKFYRSEKKPVKDFVREVMAPLAFTYINSHKDGSLGLSDEEFTQIKLKGAYSDHFRPQLMSYLNDRRGT